MLLRRMGNVRLLTVAVLLAMGCTPDESIAPTPVVTQVPGRGPTANLVTPTPIDLGTIGGVAGQSVASGINDALQIVGWSETPSGVLHGFLWQGGGMTDLGTPTGQSSRAAAINDVGRIVGHALNSTGIDVPWVWVNGQYTLLPLPTGKSGTATAIGPGTGGIIAGCMWTPGQTTSEVVKWDPAANPAYKRTTLGVPGVSKCASGIDRLQRVSANLDCCSALVWRATQFRSLGSPRNVYGMDPSGTGGLTGADLGGETVSYWPNLDLGGEYGFKAPTDTGCMVTSFDLGNAVNALGQIVGRADCVLPSAYNAFFWAAEGEDEVLPPLVPDPNGCCGIANALNLTGQVVGWSSVAPGVTHATLWGVVPEVTVLQLPPCSPRPCRIPPKVSYIPKKFINDGIITRPGFDATQLDPNSITLGDGLGHTTPVARTASGALMASVTDVDGDGVLDLKVSFSKGQLIADGVLTLTTRRLEVSAIEPTGLPWKGQYPVWVQ